MVNDSSKYADEIEDFRERNAKVHISIHIHDRRHKYLKFDKADSVLSSGLKRNPILYYAGRMIHSVEIEFAIKRICRCSDDIFTVSNYSMQCLNDIREIKNINLYFQGIMTSEASDVNEGFLLFVSAGRPEKNFYRTLEAFKRYLSHSSNSNTRLVVTGLKDEQIRRVKSMLKEYEKEKIVLMEYVDEEKLNHLYATCRALIFTSKNEGFGMPVLEALYHHKPSVVSKSSAIPEVLGSAGTYVDPLNISSIEKGIHMIMNDRYYEKIVEYTKKKLDIVKKQIALDDEVLIFRLLNYN